MMSISSALTFCNSQSECKKVTGSTYLPLYTYFGAIF